MSNEALDPKRVRIHGVQFVGTNVEMTYVVGPAPHGAETHDESQRDANQVEAALHALFEAKLGLHAITATGDLDGAPRFSVIASPLERLFHKIGPMEPLTVIKHTARTLDLSEAQAGRVGEGLAPNLAPETVLSTWDTGKLIGVLMRRPALLGEVAPRFAGVPLKGTQFPSAMLPTLPEHVADAGGVRIELQQELLEALQPSD